MRVFVQKTFSGYFFQTIVMSFVLLFLTFAFAPQFSTAAATKEEKGRGNLQVMTGGCTLFTEVEPNNSRETANTLTLIDGVEVRGGITPAGDQDFFSFHANAGDRIWAYVVTAGASQSSDTVLTLFDSAGGVIQLDDDNGFQSTLSSAIAGGVIPSTGTYTLQIRQFGGATILAPYSLYINRTSSSTVPEVEANDTLATANTYNYGTVRAGSIPTTTDEDYYTFTVAQNETVIIQVDGDPDRNGSNLNRLNQFNPNLDLLDNTGALITAVDSDSQGGNGGLLSENLRFTNTTSSSTTFAVRIKADPSTPTEDDLGIYNLHIYRVTGIACPTAALVTVSGRVTTASGRGIRNAFVTMTDSAGNSQTARTTAFGYYSFDNVAAGETVMLTVKAKQFSFNQSTIVRTTGEAVVDAHFVSDQ